MKHLFKYTPSAVELLVLVFVYIGIISVYGHYVVSMPVDILIQGAATFLVLVYTWWLSQLFYNFINKNLN